MLGIYSAGVHKFFRAFIKNTVSVCVINNSSERDIQFFRGEGLSLDCRKGMFAVFFPEDAHQPCVAPAEPAKIRKVVVKIHRSLLGKKGA